MSGLFSFSRELRRCIAGALLSIPLAAAASAPQETFLPPQSIPLPGTMVFSKLVVADVNGDHYDDIVAIGTDFFDSASHVVVDVYLNEGKPRGSAEDVVFIRQRLILKGHTNTDAVIGNVKFSTGFDLQVDDLDNDGKPDILASDAASGEIFLLWNQGANAPAPFTFVPDTSDPTAPSMTFVSQLASRGSFGPVLGTPIYVTAADLKDGSGRKSIVAYHGGLQIDPSSKEHAPFDRRNYESMAIIYPIGSGRGFDIVKQRDAWPDCDMAFGSTSPACAGWADGMAPNASLYNFRISDENGRSSLGFADAPSDILSMDGWQDKGTPQQAYVVGSYRPNAAPGLQVVAGHGANGSDAIWLQGGGQVHEFVVDNALKLMRQRTAIDTAIATTVSAASTVKERSAGTAFGTLSTGATALITGGGMRVVYDPSNPGSAVDQPVPEYLRRDGQIGGWLGWAAFGSGSALLSLSDYCRAPDPCASQLAWYHKPLSGDASAASHWGGSHTLVMLDFARETSTASGTQFEPFFQQPDAARFQAFSLTGGSLNHKPFIGVGHFASPTEPAIVMLDHTDGKASDPTWNHLAIYRSDVAKTYASPTPHLDGLTVGRFIEDGLADIGNTLPKGEVSAVLVGTNLGTDTSDGIRYVTVHDKASGAVKGIFPANPAEKVKELSKDGVVVPGLSTLDIGSYTLEVHNATASASMALKIANPFGIADTNYDTLAGKACGLLPDTKTGDLWPRQIAVAVTDFSAGALQAIRWIKDDGTVVNLGTEGASYDAAAKTLTLIVPQDGRLTDGRWRVSIKANDMWRPVPRTWNVTRDSAALASCAAQVNFVNEEAYAQCTNHDYFLDVAQYKVWPHLANGSFRFFGSGFAANAIKSAAMRQGSRRYFSSSLQLVSDNEVHVEFGDLSAQLVPGLEADIYFYPESGDVVESNGVPALGGRAHWRTPRTGGCMQSPPHFSSISGGSGDGGAIKPGDVLTAIGENLMYPVPTAIRLFLTDKDSGAQYALPPRLPDDFYSTHYDNSNGKLLFVIPNDDEWDQYLVTPPEHLSGLPALQVVYSAQAGITAMGEYTLSRLTVPGMMGWAFAQGVYMSGNTPEGVLNYLRGKYGPRPDPAPGKSGDDQSTRADELYLVIFVSQPKVLTNYANGPLDVVIIKARSQLEAMEKAPLAVAIYMTRYYSQPGEVGFFWSPTERLPLEYVAGITSVHDFGPAGDVNPNTAIVTKVPMAKAQVSVLKTCNTGSWNALEKADVDSISGLDNQWISFAWRRDVMSTNFAPAECSIYTETIGDIFLQTPAVYETAWRNNMTIF